MKEWMSEENDDAKKKERYDLIYSYHAAYLVGMELAGEMITCCTVGRSASRGRRR